jgi:hypothetical protein
VIIPLKIMAAVVNNVANIRRVLVGLRAPDTCDKPKMADFLTCLVHHFSPTQKSVTINCKIQGDMLLLYSPHDGNKLGDKHEQSTGAVNGTELESVTLYVCPEFYVRCLVYKCVI